MGNPTPSVVWEHKMGKVTNSNRMSMVHRDGIAQLNIDGVARSDEGIYRCCVLNTLGSDIRECQLVVLGKYQSRRPQNLFIYLCG